MPFSAEPEEDPAAMAALNELGFEFVNRHYLGVGVGGVSGGGEGESEVDVDMEWRGRDGWEDIGGEVVREEEFVNWFGGQSEN